MADKITTCLWFDSQAEEAAKFYVEVFKDGKLGHTTYYGGIGQEITGGKPGSVMTVEFEVLGQKFLALNGGPVFKFSEATSFMVPCEDQEEIDYYWEKLSAVPESEQCGWLKDKFGVSWQIIPKNMNDLLTSDEATAAMLKMNKIDIAELVAAGKQKQ